jgi:hypothetical protein
MPAVTDTFQGMTMPESFNLDRLQTPIGTALLVTDADGHLRALDWEDYEARMKQLLRLHYGVVNLREARAPRDMRTALAGYFKGDLDRLATIEWRVAGTPFQQKVWNALSKNPARDHAELRRAGDEARDAQSRSRRRPRQRLQSHQRRAALSPPDRRRRLARQVWRRPGAETLAAAA